jgi:hypothetical protein
MHGASMYNCSVPYRNIAANTGGGFFIGAMNDGTVLYIYFISYAYVMHIASHYRCKPNAAVVAHFHIANYGTVVGQVTIIAKSRFNTINRKYKRHLWQV